MLEEYPMGRVCSQHGCNIDVQLIEIRLLDGRQLDTDAGALLTVAKHSGGNVTAGEPAQAYTIVVMHEQLNSCHAWPEARARARAWWARTADQRARHKIELEEHYKERMKQPIGGKHVTPN